MHGNYNAHCHQHHFLHGINPVSKGRADHEARLNYLTASLSLSTRSLYLAMASSGSGFGRSRPQKPQTSAYAFIRTKWASAMLGSSRPRFHYRNCEESYQWRKLKALVREWHNFCRVCGRIPPRLAQKAIQRNRIKSEELSMDHLSEDASEWGA